MAKEEAEIVAAGGVVCSPAQNGSTSGPRVLLVHRPKYDDWSFPKGKAEPGETIEQTAVREVREETGLECRIRREAAVSHYRYKKRDGVEVPKVVHYFLMEPAGGHIRTIPDAEIDRVEWVDVGEAFQRLSHAGDREVL